MWPRGFKWNKNILFPIGKIISWMSIGCSFVPYCSVMKLKITRSLLRTYMSHSHNSLYYQRMNSAWNYFFVRNIFVEKYETETIENTTTIRSWCIRKSNRWPINSPSLVRDISIETNSHNSYTISNPCEHCVVSSILSAQSFFRFQTLNFD